MGVVGAAGEKEGFEGQAGGDGAEGRGAGNESAIMVMAMGWS